jgi:hypothetical protein
MTKWGEIIDIEGQRFGVLTVLEIAGASARRETTWRYRCVCGAIGEMRTGRLRNRPHTRCWHRAAGNSRAPEYRCWEAMRSRCLDPRHWSYDRYGGRGITICDRWRDDFLAFRADIGPRPSPKHSIERIDNDGNYEPGNCKWATAAEQRANMRCTVFVERDGKLVKLVDLAAMLGVNRITVYGRLKLGWSLEDAISVPVRPYRKRLSLS